MKFIALALVAAVVYVAQACEQQWSCQAWQKLNSEPVCFASKGDNPGIILNPCSGFISAVKLVHKSGTVLCGNTAGSHTSNWGCHNWPGLEKYPMNVLVTDKNNQVIFPKDGARFIANGYAPGKWYAVDGFNSRSNELVLQHSFNTPYYVGSGAQFKLWYAEDLFNWADTDNTGTVCADVYGYYA